MRLNDGLNFSWKIVYENEFRIVLKRLKYDDVLP